jgi:DNA polymerase III delta prime subunit
MVEASANSLLKLLEEPPQDARLILITTHRAALIPTVASRLRPYAFGERGPEQSAEVLARVFREDGGAYSSLRDYFLHWGEVNPEALRILARRFVQSLLAPAEAGEGAAPLEEVLDLVTPKTGRENEREVVRRIARIFFEELSYSLRQLLRMDAVETARLRRWNDAFRRHLDAFEVYNQQPALTIESLYYCMRGTE